MDSSDEEFIPDEESEAGPQALKSIREKLKAAISEKQEYLEGWQRARADLVNYKKEESSAHADKESRIKAALVEELLPALDALELSLKHENNPTLVMLERQFINALKKMGVEKFGAVGEEFDPRKHEALAQRGNEHLIESVERSGYSAGDTIIRPAQVII